jgi:ABC-2 type transport system ATP-binding protein
MIEAAGLSKFYGDFAAIRDVTFSIPQGQVAAFLGPNGASRSTTMKILTSYLAPPTASTPPSAAATCPKAARSTPT